MREHLQAIMDAALARVSTEHAVKRHLPPKPSGKCIVIGAGKASAAMAAAVEHAWPDVDLSGVVSTRHGHGAPTHKIKVIEAGHPFPDEHSVQAAREMFALLEGVTSNDLVLALISGGGSATLALPIEGLTLEAKRDITQRLLKSGATIGEINTVRQALSQVKGGRLAAATRPARLVSLVISDVPGDDLSLVASGPTIPSVLEGHDALSVIEAFRIEIAPNLRNQITSAGKMAKAVNQDCQTVMIASNSDALLAAAEEAAKLGYTPCILGDALECESSELGKILAAMVSSARSMGAPCEPPMAIISGGETTVTLDRLAEPGQGGRNQEVMLSLAAHIDDGEDVWAFAIDTDGFDGFVDAAGATFAPDTQRRAREMGLSPGQFLHRHDSYNFFDQLGDLIKLGPTRTNVNDLRVVLVR